MKGCSSRWKGNHCHKLDGHGGDHHDVLTGSHWDGRGRGYQEIGQIQEVHDECTVWGEHSVQRNVYQDGSRGEWRLFLKYGPRDKTGGRSFTSTEIKFCPFCGLQLEGSIMEDLAEAAG